MKEPKIPSPLLALVPIAVLVALLFASIYCFGSDSLSGSSQMCLLIASALCVLVGMVWCHRPWVDFEEAVSNNIKGVSTAVIILLIIGALSGAWMVSGVVPTLICYGMELIHPRFFLACACIICSIVSVMTGSSWSTIATIGIALMGIGRAPGFDEGWIAGAIVSGAYFGDKISPLSETTVLTSSVTETPLFTHIRYLMITTVPSMTITLIIFAIAGFMFGKADVGDMAAYTEVLSSKFHISIWLMIVPVVTAILIARKVPSIITLFISTTLALVVALIAQPGLLHEIAAQGAAAPTEGGAKALFEGCMKVLYGSTHLETGNAEINELIATRGMSGMVNTVWLIMCAMCFGGSMAASGILESITSVFVRFARKLVSMVSSTVVSGLFLNLTTADQYIGIVLTGEMFKDVYARKGYESRLLSRTIEDAVTVTSPLIPWNTCGMTQATVLNVSTFTYLPYAFFNLISPLMSIFIAMTGYKIVHRLIPAGDGASAEDAGAVAVVAADAAAGAESAAGAEAGALR